MFDVTEQQRRYAVVQSPENKVRLLMSFSRLECTPELLAKYDLPDQLDQGHRYHYFIFQHSDGDTVLLSQSHQHFSETFCTEVLIFQGRKYLVETTTDCKYVDHMWRYTLTGIRIYAGALDPRDEISRYLPDLLSLYPIRSPHTKIPKTINLEVLLPDTRSSTIIDRFPNG